MANICLTAPVPDRTFALTPLKANSAKLEGMAACPSASTTLTACAAESQRVDGTLENNGFQIWEPSPVPPGHDSNPALEIQSLEVFRVKALALSSLSIIGRSWEPRPSDESQNRSLRSSYRRSPQPTARPMRAGVAPSSHCFQLPSPKQRIESWAPSVNTTGAARLA